MIENNQRPVIVFLGPTLSENEAKEILPSAYYLPPIQCGDILQVLRLNPIIMGIVDGFFERVASVWHKEILYAIEQGVKIYGASSMGALRAAELHSLGMIGVGKIFEAYKNNKLVDDDEVTVMHQSSPYQYKALSEAMINIRYSVEGAIQTGNLDRETAHNILQSEKSKFYSQRQLKENISLVDQKKLDAIALLQKIKHDMAHVQESHNIKPIQYCKSLFLRTLHRQIACKPFSYFRHWLPIQEKVACASKLLGNKYLMVKRLAYLMSTAYAIGIHTKNNSEEAFGNKKEFYTKEWQLKNDCDATYLKAYLERLSVIRKFCDFDLNKPIDKNIAHSLLIFLKISNEYSVLKREILNKEDVDDKIIQLLMKKDKPYGKILVLTSALWQAIYHPLKQFEDTIDDVELNKHIASFRQSRKLFSHQELENWLIKNDMNEKEFLLIMKNSLLFDYIVKRNNADIIGGFYSYQNHGWFLDALYLTNMYEEAKYVLFNTEHRNQLIKKILEDNSASVISYEKLDIANGEEGFNQFISELKWFENV